VIIIWGQRLAGRSDQLPGTFYVATRYFHLYYVPLIPLKSFLIVEGTEAGAGFEGLEVPLSFKSVTFGWLRAGLVLAGIGLPFAGIANTVEALKAVPPRSPVLGAGLFAAGLLAWLLYGVTRRLSHASPRRALVLATRLGVPPEVVYSRHPVAALLPLEADVLPPRPADR
jgi:hypothetical protein